MTMKHVSYRNSGDVLKMNFVLAPLRYLLESEADPSLLDLEDNYANRADTLLSFVVQVHSFLIPFGQYRAEL